MKKRRGYKKGKRLRPSASRDEAAGTNGRGAVPALSPAAKRLYKAGVISAKNEEETVGDAVNALVDLSFDEIVVVANGCRDDTVAVAKAAGARVINYRRALGHDIGRAIGASEVDADIYLFVDADIVFKPAELAPFVNRVADGVDVALNDLDSLVGDRARAHIVSVCKYFLNAALGISELGINSMTAVPHSLSRKAVQTIGWRNLAVPPKAMVLAHQSGLRIESVTSVDVLGRNRVRPEMYRSGLGTVDKLIIGDHLEAIAVLLESESARGGFSDLLRDRESLHEIRMPKALKSLLDRGDGRGAGAARRAGRFIV